MLELSRRRRDRRHACTSTPCFSFRAGERAGRLFDPATAGGGILDVGGYPVSYARAIAGAASGVPVLEPTAVTARGTLGPTGIDEWAVADLTFPGGLTAIARTGVRLDEPDHGDDLRVARHACT